MSLKGLLKFGQRLLRGRKESATPTTGQQVDPQQFSSLFPNDAVGAAIAQRRQRGQG